MYKFLVLAAAILLMADIGMAVKRKSNKATTTQGKPNQNKLRSIDMKNLDESMTCDDWYEVRSKKMKISQTRLTRIIAGAKDPKVTLEFMIFCIMEGEPMEKRLEAIEETIDNGSSAPEKRNFEGDDADRDFFEDLF